MPSARFGQRFGERKSEVQTERRLERSWNATTAAVPLTEAERDCVFHFVPRRAPVKRSATGVGRERSNKLP